MRDERKMFEAWFASTYDDTNYPGLQDLAQVLLERDEDGYSNDVTNGMWYAWQARALIAFDEAVAAASLLKND